MQNGVWMKRSSYLAELEMRYIFALNCPAYAVGEGTTFQMLLLEYIDAFYDKSDVVSDLIEYFPLLNKKDAASICSRIQLRIKQTEESEYEDIKIRGGNPENSVIPLKLLRFQMIYHKLARILGVFNEVEDKYKYAMDIF